MIVGVGSWKRKHINIYSNHGGAFSTAQNVNDGKPNIRTGNRNRYLLVIDAFACLSQSAALPYFSG
jgi:hypothetical protein